MPAGSAAANVRPDESTDGRRAVKLPKIKTLNHQIDVIEAATTASEARLANMEKLLERISERLEDKAD
jgi:hypothetical protein